MHYLSTAHFLAAPQGLPSYVRRHSNPSSERILRKLDNGNQFKTVADSSVTNDIQTSATSGKFLELWPTWILNRPVVGMTQF